MNNYLKIDEKERIQLTGECAALIDAFAGVPLDKNEVVEVNDLLKAVSGISASALEGCKAILKVTHRRLSALPVT